MIFTVLVIDNYYIINTINYLKFATDLQNQLIPISKLIA